MAGVSAPSLEVPLFCGIGAAFSSGVMQYSVLRSWDELKKKKRESVFRGELPRASPFLVVLQNKFKMNKVV